jgi:hypothetical protein
MGDAYNWTVTGDGPWSVTFREVGDGRVVRLRVGDFIIVIPDRQAHKLGSELKIASGLEDFS